MLYSWSGQMQTFGKGCMAVVVASKGSKGTEQQPEQPRYSTLLQKLCSTCLNLRAASKGCFLTCSLLSGLRSSKCGSHHSMPGIRSCRHESGARGLDRARPRVPCCVWARWNSLHDTLNMSRACRRSHLLQASSCIW